MLRRNHGKHLGIERDNRFFHIEVTFPNLRHPKLFIKDEFSELKEGNFFFKSPINTGDLFYCYQRQSCSTSVNNAKKYEHKGDCFSKMPTLSLSFIVWDGM